MNRVSWKGQQAIALISFVGGLLFWIGYGLIKGIEFAVAICVIAEIPVFFDYWRRRRKGNDR